MQIYAENGGEFILMGRNIAVYTGLTVDEAKILEENENSVTP